MAERAKDTTNWPDMFVGLYDRLTGNNAEIIYNFENLEVDVPSSTADDASYAHWRINGSMKISTQNRGQ